MIFVLAAIASFIPYAALLLWLRNGQKKDKAYKKLFDTALLRGAISTLPVLGCSAILYLLIRLTRLQDVDPLLYQALYTFIVLAFSEELMKYLTGRNQLKKTDYPYSRLDATIIMVAAASGFGVLESVIYLIGASVPVVLVRGICLPHAGYGYLVGYYYAKSLKTGKQGIKWIGLVLAWVMHGLYDFSLSKEFAAINEDLQMVALLLAAIEIVLVIMLIVHVVKVRKREEFTQPLFPVPEAESAQPEATDDPQQA